MISDKTRYRFGSVSYSECEIARIGFQHGRDGIMYHPPKVWGVDGGGWPASDDPPHPHSFIDRVYYDAYLDGRKQRPANA